MNVPLPEIKPNTNSTLESSILNRKSVRRFLDKEIEIEKVSLILWSAQGKRENKRMVPSAGATYPLEIYVNLKNKGFYRYNFNKHLLELVSEKDLSYDLAIASLNQMFIAEAPLNVIICADYDRTCNRYGERGVRYVHIEIGHCAQNVHLITTSLGLVSVPIGAFKDDSVKKLLNLPKKFEPLYIIPIGYPG